MPTEPEIGNSGQLPPSGDSSNVDRSMKGKRDSRPHVFVMGDIAELQLFREHEKLPDYPDPAFAAYRRLPGEVWRRLPGGAWSVAQFVRAALCDVWKADFSWWGQIASLGSERLDVIDKAVRRKPPSSIDLPHSRKDFTVTAYHKNVTSQRVAVPAWFLQDVDGDHKTWQFKRLERPKRDEPTDPFHRADSFPNDGTLLDSLDGTSLDSFTIESPAAVELESIRIDSTKLSEDGDEVFLRYHTEPNAYAQIEQTQRSTEDKDGRFWIDICKDWPPSMSLMPRGSKILTAIRLVNFADLFELDQTSRMGDLSAQLLRPAIADTAFATQTNVPCVPLDLLAPRRKPGAPRKSESDAPAVTSSNQQKVQPLSEDAHRPLREFLEIGPWGPGSSNEPADGEKQINEPADGATRIVVLIDEDWKPDEPSKALPPHTHVGLMFIRPSNEEWAVWACNARIFGKARLGDSGNKANNLTVYLERLLLEFASTENSPKSAGEKDKSEETIPKYNSYFVLPIPESIGRLFNYIKRPAPTFSAPIAVVTTVHQLVTGEPETPPRTGVRPIWRVKRYGKEGKEVYRLEAACGYFRNNEWFIEQREAYRRWKKELTSLGSVSRRRCPVPSQLANETEDQELARSFEFGLSRCHDNGKFFPQWVPEAVCRQTDQYRNLVFVDLNFGFRRSFGSGKEETPAEGGQLAESSVPSITDLAKTRPVYELLRNRFAYDLDVLVCLRDRGGLGSEESREQLGKWLAERGKVPDIGPSTPDWWWPLLHWACSGLRGPDKTSNWSPGWIVGILGRQLPLADEPVPEGADPWAIDDLWSLLRRLDIPNVKTRLAELERDFETYGKSVLTFKEDVTTLINDINRYVEKEVVDAKSKVSNSTEGVFDKEKLRAGLIAITLSFVTKYRFLNSTLVDMVYDITNRVGKFKLSEAVIIENKKTEIDEFLRTLLGIVRQTMKEIEDRWLRRNDDSRLASAKRTVPIRDRTVVIVSGNLLRAQGARIGQRLSWERTATDCLDELRNNPKLKPLLEFAHVVVRFGCTGAVHVSRVPSVEKLSAAQPYLFYDASARDGYHRTPSAGHVIGANSVFAATITRELVQLESSSGAEPSPSKVTEVIHRAIRESIKVCQDLYDRGYGSSFEETDPTRIVYTAPEELLFAKYPVRPKSATTP